VGICRLISTYWLSVIRFSGKYSSGRIVHQPDGYLPQLNVFPAFFILLYSNPVTSLAGFASGFSEM
jgi:hypothetical protein